MGYRHLWRTRLLSLNAWSVAAMCVVAAVLIGVVAWFIKICEGWSVDFFDAIQGRGEFLGITLGGWWTWIVPAALVTGGMVAICFLRDRVFPGTQGTGIPQSIAALRIPEGPRRGAMLSMRIAVGKILLLIMGLFSGATIGREGPSVHVGACLMYLLTKFIRCPEHLIRRGLILGGGGAGIAAAFNAPVAGIVFAFEEIGRSFEKQNAGIVIRTVVIATLASMVFLGDYIFYGRVSVSLETPGQWLIIPVIAIVGGTLGGLFARGVVGGTIRVNRFHRSHPVRIGLFLGLGLAVLGAISSGATYGGGFVQAQAMLMDGAESTWSYPVLKAAASWVSLVSGIPGGLFDPSLSVGASLGVLAAPMASSIFDGVSSEAVILMFMVAYFGGVVQSPITAAVILVEMTACRSMAVPLLLTSAIAYECSHLVCRISIYEALADIFLGGISKDHHDAAVGKQSG
jgi:H+/Cl- antiporter ClcA